MTEFHTHAVAQLNGDVRVMVLCDQHTADLENEGLLKGPMPDIPQTYCDVCEHLRQRNEAKKCAR